MQRMNGLQRPASLLAGLLALSLQGSLQAEDQETTFLRGTLIFGVEYEDIVTPMRYYSDGKHLRVELGEDGDPYLVWIRGIDGMDGIAALSPIEKNYSVEFDGPPMWDWLNNDGSVDKRRRPKDPELPDGNRIAYLGFDCHEYDLNTDGPDTRIVMLENAQPLPYLVTRLWKNLTDASRHLQLLSERHKGIPVIIERKKWSKRAFFSLKLLSHDSRDPDPAMFSIPEGYYQVASQIRGGRRGGSGGGKGSGGGHGPGGE